MVNRKRNVAVTVRMTEEEKNKFDELVKKSRLSQSDFFIKTALQKKIYDVGIKNDLRSVQHELSKIGTNINQIAKNLNSNIYSGADKDVREMTESLENLQDDFRKIILKIRNL